MERCMSVKYTLHCIELMITYVERIKKTKNSINSFCLKVLLEFSKGIED